MAYHMRIDEMLCCLTDNNIPKAQELRAKVQQVADELAKAMRDHFDVASGRASFDMGETMVPFGAKHEGQVIPTGMVGYDTADEFDFNALPCDIVRDQEEDEDKTLPRWLVRVQTVETFEAMIHAASEDQARADAMIIWPESGTDVFESASYDWSLIDVESADE